MKVEVKLFAVARQLAGSDSITVDVPDDACVRELRAAIAAAYPGLADAITHVAFAIDADYASDDTRIPANAEVACIPPVSGG